jgi:hypothetical protein
MDGLRDIKGLSTIPDYSLYIFLGLVVFAIVALVVTLKAIYSFIKSKKKIDTKALYLKKLKNIDFTDSKSAAYKLTKYGKILADDESKREIFSKLTDDLQKYKYKKNPPAFDEDSIKLYRLFLEVCSG